MKKIIKGFLKFKTDVYPEWAQKYRDLAEGQNPHALFIACCDSRVLPNMLTGSGPGDLFVVRSVGNLIAPATSDGISVGDVSEASAIEYALDVLGVRDIIVCGHSRCGAMAAIEKEDKTGLGPNLIEWLKHGEPAKDRMRAMEFSDELNSTDKLSQANVLVQRDNVASYKTVQNHLRAGSVNLHATWLDIRTSQLYFFDETGDSFFALASATTKA